MCDCVHMHVFSCAFSCACVPADAWRTTRHCSQILSVHQWPWACPESEPWEGPSPCFPSTGVTIGVTLPTPSLFWSIWRVVCFYIYFVGRGHTWRSEISLPKLFLPSTVWVLGIELRLSSLKASARGAILLSLRILEANSNDLLGGEVSEQTLQSDCQVPLTYFPPWPTVLAQCCFT